MNLTTIIAVSDDLRMVWEVNLLLESLEEQNFKYPVHILIFKPHDRKDWIKDWDKIEELYPEVKFFRYADDGSIRNLLSTYHTIHRLFSLKEHFKAFPELEKHAILYLDSDILLTKPLDLDKYLEDDICYGADIRSYNNQEYFDGKISRVRTEKLEKYKKEDPLNQLWKSLGVDRELLKKYNDHTAGVHYLLKNVNAQFWEDILYQCIPTILQLEYLNQEYIEGQPGIERKNNGWQAFCADIYLTLWSLWKRGTDTKILPELNFTWSTDLKEKIKDTWWLHNAGVSDEDSLGGKTFFKGRRYYVNNQRTPFDKEEESYLESILNDPITEQFANHYYTEHIQKVKNKYYEL